MKQRRRRDTEDHDSAPARRSRTPSAAVERELLAAAEAVLVRDGQAGLTVRAVAAEAGVAPMGVYNRLGGKDGLIDALTIKGFDRLRTTLETGDDPDGQERLRSCCLRYRAFAVRNKDLYALMLKDAPQREYDSAEVGNHASAAVGALARIVELAAATGALDATELFEVTWQIWCCLHGAVALELRGLVLTPDPETTYRALLETLIRGLAPVPFEANTEASSSFLSHSFGSRTLTIRTLSPCLSRILVRRSLASDSSVAWVPGPDRDSVGNLGGGGLADGSP